MNEIMQSEYLGQMEEIKRRMEVIVSIERGEVHALYSVTTVETAYLQFRKILELISMASLVANKEVLMEIHGKKLATYWRAKALLDAIEAINSDFYPNPITEIPSGNPAIKSELKGRQDDFLSRTDFVCLYDLCSNLVHTSNPLAGTEIDYESHKKNITKWRMKIINLLNCHTIRLVNDENLYLVHIKEERDDKVHIYTFAPHQLS